MTKLEKLEHKLNNLLLKRTRKIERAHLMIAQANKEFDEVATPIMREVKRLRAEMLLAERAERHAQPNHKPASYRRPQPVSLRGLSQEDADHYRDLVAQYK